MAELLVVGSLNADLVVSARRAPEAGETVRGDAYSFFRGGKGGNQAVAAARLGGTVSLVGRIGSDANGMFLMEGLREEAVNVEGVRELSGLSTGMASITVEAGGENRIVVISGANGAFTPEELEKEEAAFERARFVLVQLEIPMDTVQAVLKRAKRAGCITILDPAPPMELSDEVLELVDYLTPNEGELFRLSGVLGYDREDEDEVKRAAERLLIRGVGTVVATRGARGAMLVTEGKVISVEAPCVDAVDTTAAGDCFNAAFAVGLARQDGEEAALAFACAAASLSVTREGAQASLPYLKEIG